MNEKIFINIASYRDPSLAITIKSALQHAKNPENLVFGIGAQYYAGEMPRLDIKESQIKILYYDPDKRPGVAKVRYEISQLVTDEKYFYMIDSHTLFLPEWDVLAINYLKQAQELSDSANVVLSGCGVDTNKEAFSLPRYFLDNVEKEDLREKFAPIVFRTFNSEIFKTGSLTKHHHIDFSNFFTLSTLLTEVELNKHSHFLFEEPYLSWRAFMSGWDVYTPRERYAHQNPQAYFNIVWGNDWNKRDYLRPEDAEEEKKQAPVLFEAFVFNKPNNIFAIKNAKRSSNDFWELAKPSHIVHNVLDGVKDSGMFERLQEII
jgi:hypothetical protein